MGEVNHTTECVTDLFGFVDFEWGFVWSNSNYLDSNGRKDVIIEIDGGVTPETAPKLVKAGANMLTCGTGTIYSPKEAPLDIKIGQFKNQVNRELEYAI